MPMVTLFTETLHWSPVSLICQVPSTERTCQIYRLMLQSEAGNDPRVWALVFELDLFKNLS